MKSLKLKSLESLGAPGPAIAADGPLDLGGDGPIDIGGDGP